MEIGSKEINTELGATITVRCSEPFCVFGMEGKNKTLILGPYISTARLLRYKLPDDMSRVYIKTKKSADWTLDWTFASRSEHNDNTPIELPVGYDYPESLADQMRRFIREEVSASRDEGKGSFEEEDDFTDDEEPLSQYEMTDMQEVEEIDWEEDPQKQLPLEEKPAEPVEEIPPKAAVPLTEGEK